MLLALFVMLLARVRSDALLVAVVFLCCLRFLSRCRRVLAVINFRGRCLAVLVAQLVLLLGCDL